MNDDDGVFVPKYVVLKTADLERERPGLLDMVLEDVEPLTDAEVIRKQDITSGSVFHLYANLIVSFIELMEGPHPVVSTYDALRQIADHFHEAANESDELRKQGAAKLPD